MLIKNRYYIVKTNDENLNDILDCCVENSVKELKNSGMGVVKLRLGDKKDYECLKGYPEFNHSEILVELQKKIYKVELEE